MALLGMANKLRLSDDELMKRLQIDSKTLSMFKKVREDAIKEAKQMGIRKNKKIKVLGISGSAREEGDTSRESSNSEALLKKCLRYCKEMGAETESVEYKLEYGTDVVELLYPISV